MVFQCLVHWFKMIYWFEPKIDEYTGGWRLPPSDNEQNWRNVAVGDGIILLQKQKLKRWGQWGRVEEEYHSCGPWENVVKGCQEPEKRLMQANKGRVLWVFTLKEKPETMTQLWKSGKLYLLGKFNWQQQKTRNKTSNSHNTNVNLCKF